MAVLNGMNNSSIGIKNTAGVSDIGLDKFKFEGAIKPESENATGGKKVAFVWVLAPWVIDLIAASVGAGAITWLSKNIWDGLNGATPNEGLTGIQQAQRSQVYKKIQGHSKFSTLSPEMQANVNSNVMKAEGGNQGKVIGVVGRSSIVSLRKKGPNRPPKNNKTNIVANQIDNQTGFQIPKMWTSNSLKDLPVKLYRIVADWAEHASIKNSTDKIDTISIARTPKANPLNPTEVSNNTDMMAAQDGFVKFQRNLLDGPKTDFFLKITTNGRSRFINALELYEKLQNKLPH